MCAVTTDALGLACEQALPFGRAKQAALWNARTSGKAARGRPRAPLSRLLSRASRASTFHDIHKGELARMLHSDKLHP